MPLVLAGLAIERDDRGDEQVVALALAPDTVVPGIRAACADEDAASLGIVGHGIPHRGLAAEFPPFARPGLGGDLRGFVLVDAGLAGNGVEPPELLAGLGVIGRHIAADRAGGAGETDDDSAVEYPRRAVDLGRILGPDRHGLPDEFSGPGVERDQATVLRTGVDLAVPPGDPAHPPANPQVEPGLLGGARIVLPQLLARHGIDGVDNAEPGGEIEHAINGERLGDGIARRQVHRPGQTERGHVALVDLAKRAVVLLAIGSAVARPVVGAGAVEQTL